MISKLQFIQMWNDSDATARKELADTVKVSSDWSRDHTDPGCATFLGTLGEFIVREFLNRHRHLYHWDGANDFIYQVTDYHVSLAGKPDFKLYSNRQNQFVPAEVKYTRYACVDTFDQISIPDHIFSAARKEHPDWIFIIDELTVVSRDPGSFAYGKLSKGSKPHLIAYNVTTKQSTLLAGPAEVKSIISDILGGNIDPYLA